MMAAALKDLICEIIPYHCLPGHPYMTDIIIETSTPFSNDSSALNDMPALSDTPASATTALSTESNFATVNQK